MIFLPRIIKGHRRVSFTPETRRCFGEECRYGRSNDERLNSSTSYESRRLSRLWSGAEKQIPSLAQINYLWSPQMLLYLALQTHIL